MIKGKKFFIEVDQRGQAELLKIFLGRTWIQIDMAKPAEMSGGFWREQELHADGKTRIFEISWDSLHLRYLPYAERDPQKANALQTVMSREISDWIQAADDVEKSTARENVKKRIAAQKGCRHCQSLGIDEVDFDFLF